MQRVGYWGPVTSTVDWCEANYEHSHYVAEFFNTTSSVAIVLAGVAGLVMHRRALERRFSLAFLLVALVGIGSIAFHATLRFSFQMLDELPMLYAVLVMTYILVENHATPRLGRWFPAALVAWGVVVTIATAWTRGPLQFYLFQGSFGSLEVFSLYQVFQIHRKSTNPNLHRLFRIGISAYATAIVLWFADIRFCAALSSLPRFGLPNPQLHAVWHVLVSIGFYALLMVIAKDRERFVETRPRNQTFPGRWSRSPRRESPEPSRRFETPSTRSGGRLSRLR
jgi:dihydroceramidase